MDHRLFRNPPSSTTSCVHVCLCALLPVVPLNKVHPLPCKHPPSVSLPLGHLSCCFRAGGWRPPYREDQMVEWSLSLLALSVAHPGLQATWGMAGRHPQP